MSTGLTPDRLLNGQSRLGAGKSFWLDPTPRIPANCATDSLNLPEAQLASLRRALQFDFGPDLSGIRVYVGPQAGQTSTKIESPIC